ncbi:hypothetical protein LWI29_032497 [Acer saccharum]|uniref:Uncharacterized protein n=1 Tax=Acer saccharum TaxID=4024 RepID=A0AA39RRW1_ACESA|nr:hypothetical protein LWI29_032497 [Acer saccharum]
MVCNLDCVVECLTNCKSEYNPPRQVWTLWFIVSSFSVCVLYHWLKMLSFETVWSGGFVVETINILCRHIYSVTCFRGWFAVFNGYGATLLLEAKGLSDTIFRVI